MTRLAAVDIGTNSVRLLVADVEGEGSDASLTKVERRMRITRLGQGVDARLAFANESATAATVEELLRIDPPLHLFMRYALEDVDFAGVRLKKGDRIGVLLGAANRDPERFPRPEVFDYGRVPNPHVSFGAGIHFCVGAPLARLELGVTLPILFARLPDLRLAETPRLERVLFGHGKPVTDDVAGTLRFVAAQHR